jgi:hypothetical protein
MGTNDMPITLTPEQEAWLQSHVATGAFASIEQAARQLIDERIAERVSCRYRVRQFVGFTLSPTPPFLVSSMTIDYVGSGILGAPVSPVPVTGRLIASAAVRILHGEAAGDIKTPPIGYGALRFDWREMQRWGITANRLPPGSEVLFRPPTTWEQYRWQITLIAAVVMIQTILIIGLYYEHRRRRNAEASSRNAMDKLAEMNRFATAGELTASIAHEVKQPGGYGNKCQRGFALALRTRRPIKTRHLRP